jgi:hypothetical protein
MRIFVANNIGLLPTVDEEVEEILLDMLDTLRIIKRWDLKLELVNLDICI